MFGTALRKLLGTFGAVLGKFVGNILRIVLD
jgi:hypothetical protein